MTQYPIVSMLTDGNPLVEHIGGGVLLLRTDIFLKRKVLATAADTKYNDIIPANYMLKEVIVQNNTANAVTITAGTTDDGTDIIASTEIGDSAIEVFTVNKMFSMTAANDFCINSADWNSATVNVFLLLEKPLTFTTFTDVTLLV